VHVHRESVWLGTGNGLSRTRDEGQTFESFTREHGLGKGGVSGLAVSDNIIWVATGFDTITEFGSFQAGGGLAYSLDDGVSWLTVPQPIEPVGTNVNNITFDIALRGDEVWITSFAGSLQRSSDRGQSWELIPPDSFLFDVGRISLNHRAFAVIVIDSVLWVGTAEGINRSTDGGETWTQFTHRNQEEPISGNFVVGFGYQKYANNEILWAATRETTSETNDTTEFRGVSWTGDQGFSWKTALRGANCHNIAFDDSIVYVASDFGLFKSDDGGETWALFSDISNPDNSRRIYGDAAFDAGVTESGNLMIGTENGLAITNSNGRFWTIQQVFSETGQDGEGRTYAYPNPFSPGVHNRLGGVGHVRFQYNTINDTEVTLKVYDFSMRLVATVAEGQFRLGNGDFYEVWDGLDGYGERVANGVYFYELTLSGDGKYWGKLVVMN
jgi:ligand-binding sensor domain-containing protein